MARDAPDAVQERRTVHRRILGRVLGPDSDDSDDWVYFPEDGAKIDEDGYITVLGRVDDVINVSGHRLGTMEIESAIVGVEGVAEAAVVGGDHDIKGEAVYAYVITEDGYDEDEELRSAIIDGVEDAIGPIARPEAVIFTPELPKTRSGRSCAACWKTSPTARNSATRVRCETLTLSVISIPRSRVTERLQEQHHEISSYPPDKRHDC